MATIQGDILSFRIIAGECHDMGYDLDSSGGDLGHHLHHLTTSDSRPGLQGLAYPDYMSPDVDVVKVDLHYGALLGSEGLSMVSRDPGQLSAPENPRLLDYRGYLIMSLH